ncbi:hypothetical protein SAMN05192534_106102 [Alteribacillus persepolensis]|uniref:Uncharacterized protein n=1 Tax=Alteribacillus persepolensis TaxID=568899 RepID=A0A1G8CVT9_9BACI|nr:hypothetical protein [Alteribacillus persepolensis]SDH49611.1 hypothetical protein SAMN05192534_106102 [Alteribacillus persepolensis]
MAKTFFIWTILILILFNLYQVSFATHNPKTNLSVSFTEPDNIFSELSSSVEILHISDDDEYLLEWEANADTLNNVSLLQEFSLLFEDGYLKDASSSWTEEHDEITITKKTTAEESSRYHLITFHSAKTDDTFTFDWSEDTLYVLDTPMTDMHSFKKPKTKDDEKSKKILDAVINQQKDHIKRIIREEANLHQDVLLFPLEDIAAWKKLTNPDSPSHLPLAKLEDMWGNIYATLLHVSKNQPKSKKGMPFLSWDEKQQKMALYIHYSHF